MKKMHWIFKRILTGVIFAGLSTGYVALAADPENTATYGTNDGSVTVVNLGVVDLSSGGSSAGVAQKSTAALAAPAKGSVHLRPDAPAPVPFQQQLNGDTFQIRSAKPRNPFEVARELMLTNQLAAAGRGISTKVIDAMSQVPRHNFVPSESLADAYQDKALEIDPQRTLEAPFTVASKAEQLNANGTDRVLELATGSGYQTAVLSHLAREVYSVESSENLAERARFSLAQLGYTNNVFLRHGDVSEGWPEAAPFDAIIVVTERIKTGQG